MLLVNALQVQRTEISVSIDKLIQMREECIVPRDPAEALRKMFAAFSIHDLSIGCKDWEHAIFYLSHYQAVENWPIWIQGQNSGNQAG